MEPTRWNRLEALVGEALDQPEHERAAFLHSACEEDAELLKSALSLLARAAAESPFLAHPLVDLAAVDAASTLPVVGGYRLLHALGHGGMGDVYLAERQVGDVTQVVALKVIRPGMATEEVLRRFRLERRILAGLQHPAIARLLDAGATADGLPYFAMEYLDGQPLDTYCDTHGYSIRRRLALFLTVCSAVQHAHGCLVIHRDLKPRNVLVGEGDTVKLLDFGIGKVLAPDEPYGTEVETRTAHRVLTPEYAAPEQLAGAPITTASDVYALGILLHELLLGGHPYLSGHRSLAEIERAARETDPPKPSTVVVSRDVAARRGTSAIDLRRQLAGDLDMILLKALRKEPARRYSSVAAFADDVSRHLRGLPVFARPDTFRYRTGKFIHRNLAGVAVASTIFLAMAATTIVTLVQSRRLTAESARVATERDKAIEVRGFLLEMFGATGADQAVGDTATVRGLLDRQAALVEQQYEDRPAIKADMLDVLADGYDRLGLYPSAEPLARKALAIRQGLLGDDHPDVATSLNALGWILHERGNTAEAEPYLRKAVAIRREAGSPARLDLSRSLNDLGVILSRLARYPEAEAVLDEALAIRRGAWGDRHRTVGITANNLAVAYFNLQRWSEAARAMEVSLTALAGTVGPDHQRTIIALGNLAILRRQAGEAAAAESTYRELLVRQTRIQGPEHPVTAHVMSSLSLLLSDRAGNPGGADALREADSLLRRAAAIQETALGREHPDLAVTLERLGSVLLGRGDLEGALEVQGRAVRMYEKLFGNEDPRTGSSWTRLAAVHDRRGDLVGATNLLVRAHSLLVRTSGPVHTSTALAALQLCDVLIRRRTRLEEARGYCVAAEQALVSAPEGFKNQIPHARLRLAESYLLLGNPDAADSLLVRVRAAADSSPVRPFERRLLDSLTAARAVPGHSSW